MTLLPLLVVILEDVVFIEVDEFDLDCCCLFADAGPLGNGFNFLVDGDTDVSVFSLLSSPFYICQLSSSFSLGSSR